MPSSFTICYPINAFTFLVLADVWSRGCNPQLRYALPIMFAWEVLGLALSALGVYRRAHYATLAEEAQENQFRERLDAAVEYELKRDREIRGEIAAEARGTMVAEHTVAGADEEEKTTRAATDQAAAKAAEQSEGIVREELSRVISTVNERARREQRKNEHACGFGPSFTTPFGGDDSDDS